MPPFPSRLCDGGDAFEDPHADAGSLNNSTDDQAPSSGRASAPGGTLASLALLVLVAFV